MSIKVNRYGFAAILAGLLLSSTAHAVVIQPGAEKSLDSLFNTPVTGWIKSGDSLDVNGSEQVTSAGWSLGALDAGSTRIIAEIAGNAAYNTFGIYDLTDASNRLELFDGSKSAQATTYLEYLGSNTFTNVKTGNTATFGGSTFGFYLGVPGSPYYFYSDASLNGGHDQVVAFQGGNNREVDFTGFGTRKWLTDEWVLAWEDLPYLSSDKDFNDFIVAFESVAPASVPEPGTLALLASGLLFSTGFASCRRGKNAKETAA